MRKKQVCSASVRTVVEFSLLSGDLVPGMSMMRMREGMLGHQARQQASPDARAEVSVKGRAEGERVTLEIGGRIDLLYEREGVPVVEEIKLAPYGDAPTAAYPAHRAQAVCYGHLLKAPRAVIRVMYVRADGENVAAFEEEMTAQALAALFEELVRPYLRVMDGRAAWCEARDASIAALSFPYQGYRQGQREMAAQVYWAIKSKKRLFAQAPTGTGKTAAAIFPALKALGEGITGQIFYLTARTTGRQNATASIERMRGEGLRLRVLALTAKEKICPEPKAPGWRCDLLACERAKGFFDRLPAGMEEIRGLEEWSREAVEAVAERHRLCPFELALTLCEEADMVVCDYNYAFDPAARIRRIFLGNPKLTLLVDEAHNLPERGRSMLSAVLDSEQLRAIRRDVGLSAGRKAPVYRTLTALIQWVEAQEEEQETTHLDTLQELLRGCMDAAMEVARTVPLGELPRTLVASLATLDRFDEGYTVYTEPRGKRIKRVNLFCMDPAQHLRQSTQKLRGCVFFSATMTPLAAWRDAIGGEEDDGLLSLASPFPPEHLLVLRHDVSTRYTARSRTVRAVAEAIAALVKAQPGNYLACFPSYAYLRQVQEALEPHAADITLHVQQGGMDEASRAAFLEAFRPRETGALLGLIVMGGVFSEGVDLPGSRLSGVAIVGVGLPQVCRERELLRAYYAQKLGDGFAHAYRYPGMNKVLQAVGRVIRTETDRGVALLIDDRFLTWEYAALMPYWWGSADVAKDAPEIRRLAGAFWREDVYDQ